MYNQLKPEELARYLSGNSTDQEKERIEAWKKETPENRKKYEEYQQLWKHSAKQPNTVQGTFNTREDWEVLRSKIDADQSRLTPYSPDYSTIGLQGNRGWQTFMRVAVIFLVAGLIGFMAYQQWQPVEEIARKPALREITTDIGQRVNLTLSDGTKVLLNAGSKMKLPEIFDDDKREVFLEGQAYFDVAKNPNKPFVIHSGNAQTRVLGTSFSVSAYPTDEQITIAVKEGRVSFQAGNETKLKETIVNGQEFAQFDVKTRQLDTRRMDDSELYLGWIDGYLKFKETPMDLVATELERRYGVSITFLDQQIKKQSLTAMLKGRSIQNVLNVISMSLAINYELEGDQVFFYK